MLLLAAVLRFAGITFDSLWLDESYQTLASSVGQPLPDLTAVVDEPFLFRFGTPRPLPELLSHFRQVDPLCPPMYPVLLNRWMALFGPSDLAIRSLSALLSTLSVAVVFWCARLLFGPGPALVTAFIQAVSPFDIHYGQEARMYSLAILLSALSCGSFFALLRSKRFNMRTGVATAIYAIATWALINTHYTALFVAMFQGLFGLWMCARGKQWRLLALLSTGWIAVFILWLPWLDMFRQAAAVRSGTFYVARAPSLWWPAWAFFVKIPLNWIVFLAGKKVVAYAVPVYLTSVCFLLSALSSTLPPQTRKRLGKRLSTDPDAGAFPGGAEAPAASATDDSVFESFPGGCASFPGRSAEISQSAAGEPRQPSPRAPGSTDIAAAPQAAAFVWCWAILPAVFVWLVDVIESHRVIEISRYVSATAPAIYILAGVGSVGMGIFRFRHVSAARLVLIAHAIFATINNVHDHVSPQREPWREMAAEVERRCHPGELVLVSQYYDIACLDRYLTKPMLQVGVSPAQGADHVSRVVCGRELFWLLTAQEGEAITGMIPPQFTREQAVTLPHGLHLRLYRKVR